MASIAPLLDKVHRSDAARFIAKLPDKSIDFVMTSPPYWGLRDYGVEGQIGLEKHPRDYIATLVKVFADLRRVLAPHGSFFLNLGDTYCSTKGMCDQPGGSRQSIPRPGYAPLVRERNPNRLLKPDGGWLQPKQLLMLPVRVAVALQEDGWILRNDIIWHKPNGMPCSAKDRLANKYEHLFHFVKSKRYFYDLDAIRVPHTSRRPRTKAGKVTETTIRHLMPCRRNDLATSNAGRSSKPHSVRLAGVQGILHPGGKNPGDFLSIATTPYPSAHFAVYPEALCEQPIRAACPAQVCSRCGRPRERVTVRVGYAGKLRRDYSQPRHVPESRTRRNRSAWGEQPVYQTTGWTKCRCKKGSRPGIAFDPFAGAGTTLVVAKRLARSFLGADLSPAYVKLAKQRLEATIEPASGSRHR